jgi:FkbM family methyltransferase
MPHFRPNTWDENIWNDIVNKNEYGVHDQWPHNLIDIGGHIGSFSYKMLSKHNTKKVVIVEPNTENYNLLKINLAEFIRENKVITLNRGIGRPETKLDMSDETLGTNTGGCPYFESKSGRIDSISLDSIIDMIDDGDSILLKIDCEGCEYEALSSCTKLSKINCIVGEFHDIDEVRNIGLIRDILKEYNFSYHYKSHHLGLFGAHK